MDFEDLSPAAQLGELALDACHAYKLPRSPRAGAFHPSSINQCQRRQCYEYLGADAAPITSPRRIDHGNEFDRWAKQHILQRYRDAGYTVLTADTDSDGREIPYLPLRDDHPGHILTFPGTPDAVVLPGPVVVDFKATAHVKQKRCKDSGLNDKDDWWWQMQSYMFLADSQQTMVFMESVTERGQAVWGYTTLRVHEPTVKLIHQRLALMQLYLERDGLPPKKCSKPEQCPYVGVCFGGKA